MAESAGKVQIDPRGVASGGHPAGAVRFIADADIRGNGGAGGAAGGQVVAQHKIAVGFQAGHGGGESAAVDGQHAIDIMGGLRGGEGATGVDGDGCQ